MEPTVDDVTVEVPSTDNEEAPEGTVPTELGMLPRLKTLALPVDRLYDFRTREQQFNLFFPLRTGGFDDPDVSTS